MLVSVCLVAAGVAVGMLTFPCRQKEKGLADLISEFAAQNPVGMPEDWMGDPVVGVVGDPLPIVTVMPDTACARIEKIITDNLPLYLEESRDAGDQLRLAQEYIQLYQNGCPVNRGRHFALAKRALDVALGLERYNYICDLDGIATKYAMIDAYKDVDALRARMASILGLDSWSPDILDEYGCRK